MADHEAETTKKRNQKEPVPREEAVSSWTGESRSSFLTPHKTYKRFGKQPKDFQKTVSQNMKKEMSYTRPQIDAEKKDSKENLEELSHR